MVNGDREANGDGVNLRIGIGGSSSSSEAEGRNTTSQGSRIYSANGDVMVGEMRLRTLMAGGADMLAAELDSVLGTAWDESLEPYRDGGDAGEVSWLNRGVG